MATNTPTIKRRAPISAEMKAFIRELAFAQARADIAALRSTSANSGGMNHSNRVLAFPPQEATAKGE